MFTRVGREQLIVLLEHGLRSDSRVLDVGCGVLRAGRWIIPLLDPQHYCGLEPRRDFVAFGIEHFVGDAMARLKQPRFDHNTSFDLSVFGTTFTHLIARSIWTHATKSQIEQMLDAFTEVAAENGVFLTSFLPAASGTDDYLGSEWIDENNCWRGRAVICHDWGWIVRESRQRGITATLLNRTPINGQRWIRLARSPSMHSQ